MRLDKFSGHHAFLVILIPLLFGMKHFNLSMQYNCMTGEDWSVKFCTTSVKALEPIETSTILLHSFNIEAKRDFHNRSLAGSD